MCAGGWAKEDPGRWPMTWYDTRYLFVKIFYFRNKSIVDGRSMCFSPFTSSAVQVWPILTWEESSLNSEREKRQSLWFVFPSATSSKMALKHEPCTSGYTACVLSRFAMEPVYLKLLVWTQRRGKKLSFVIVSFSTRKYPGLTVSRPNVDNRDLETELASLCCALLSSLCCTMGNTSHQSCHWLDHLMFATESTTPGYQKYLTTWSRFAIPLQTSLLNVTGKEKNIWALKWYLYIHAFFCFLCLCGSIFKDSNWEDWLRTIIERVLWPLCTFFHYSASSSFRLNAGGETLSDK